MRNPFERILSHYIFTTKKPNWNLDITDGHLINTSDYFLQLNQHRQYFHRESIILIYFDDLKYKPAQVLHRVYEFLGITPTYYPRKFRAKKKTVKPLNLEWMLSAPALNKIINFLPSPLKGAGNHFVLKNSSPPDYRK